MDRILSRCLLLAALLALCPFDGPAQSITGTATFRERVALADDAVFEAVLQDVSRADAGAPIIGRVRIAGPLDPPIAFEIAYDPARIRPEGRYGVSARIRVGDRLVFASEHLVTVLTRGDGTNAALLMRGAARSGPSHASAAPGEAAPLHETYWRLTHVREVPVDVAPRAREPHLVFRRDGGRVTGSGGCNRLVGGFMQTLEQIDISGIGLTRMACPSGMEQEARFARALGDVVRWRVEGRHLDLFDVGGARILRFEAAEPR